MLDRIGAGQGAVHAVERRRLGRAQVARRPRRPGRSARRARGRPRPPRPRSSVRRAVADVAASEVLEAVLDPLHRRAGLARRQAHQDNVGKHRLLHAEAAAGVAGIAVAQPVGRHLEREGHHRVQRERAHEIGGDVVAGIAGKVLGDHHPALDRRARVAREARRQRHTVRGAGERPSRAP